jgi:hypothetical protein
MGPDTGLSFSLVTEQDEGICPLALIRFLAELHNNFVQLVDVSPAADFVQFSSTPHFICMCVFLYWFRSNYFCVANLRPSTRRATRPFLPGT